MDDGRLGSGVVRVASLTEEGGSGTDQDEAAVPVSRDFTQKAARGQKCRGQVAGDRRVPALQRELPDGGIFTGRDACNSGADVELPEQAARVSEKAVDLVLFGQVGPR